MGNCLERAQSDEADEGESNLEHQSSSRQGSHSRSNSHRNHRHRSSQNHYTRLNSNTGNSSSSSSLISLNTNQQRIIRQTQDINHNYLHGRTSIGSFQTTNGSSIFSPSSSLPDSLQISSMPTGSFGISSLFTQGYSQNSMSTQQVFYLNPSVQRTADQLTEEEQIKLLKRMTLIQQLPSGTYEENKKHKECVICMIDFEVKDQIKCLPCMHTFHQSCIDSWLVRSLICPSCMEPVDAGLLSAFENE